MGDNQVIKEGNQVIMGSHLVKGIPLVREDNWVIIMVDSQVITREDNQVIKEDNFVIIVSNNFKEVIKEKQGAMGTFYFTN